MTDKLPEWIEKFMRDSVHVGLGNGSYGEGYNAALDHVAAFLAQYVLCEKEPVGHAVPSRKGDAITMAVAALRVSGDKTTPLHIPAKDPK